MISMEQETTQEVALEAVPVVEATEKPKKTRAKRTTTTKPRQVEELYDAELKTLSDKEKNMLIEAQKEELALLRAQNTAYKNNCEAAYEKLRITENNFNTMEKFYSDKLMFISRQTLSFAETIKLVTLGGVN